MPVALDWPMNVLVFGNVNLRPFANNLLPVIRAFERLAAVRLVEPFRFEGFVGTGAARPAPIPEAAVRAGLDGFAPDAVICLAGALLVPPPLRPLLPSGAPLVGIALSDPYGLDASLEIAPLFDLFYTQDPQTLPAYRAAGIEARRCDPATDPELYHPIDGAARLCDLIFFGKWTPFRDEVLRALAPRFRLNLHAHPAEARLWSMPPLPPLETPDELRAALNGARAAIEFALLDDAPEPYRGTGRITNRAQMAAACGVPVLISDFPALRDYFEPGEEIETFRDAADAPERAGALLGDERRRLEMGRRARARVLREQTWDVRARSILSDLASLPGRRP